MAQPLNICYNEYMKRVNNWQRSRKNIPREILCRLYTEKHLSIEAVALELGCCGATVLKYLRLHGIPRRPRVGWGDGHHHWKGGRYLGGEYWMCYKPDHPRASKNCHYVREHILVWEKANGKLLPKGWHIHHINGIKADNRIVNLKAIPSKKHYLVLVAKNKRIQELEALLNQQGQLC